MKSKLRDLLLAQLIPVASSFITTFATAGLLGAVGRGRLALAISGSSLVGALGFLSLQVGIVRAYRMGDLSALGRGFRLASILSVIVFVCGATLAVQLSNVQFGIFDRQMIMLMAIGGGLVIMNLVVLRTRQGIGDARVFRNAALLQATMFPLAGIPVALVTRSPSLVVLCWFLSLASATTFASMHGSRTVIEQRPHVRVATGEILTSSIAAHMGVAGQQLLHSADIMVLGLLSTAATVGVYSLAVPIVSVVWILSETLSLMAFDLSGEPQPTLQKQLQRSHLFRLNLMGGIFGGVVIGLASLVLIPLVLPEYTATIPLVLIMLPGVIIQGYARIGLSSMLLFGTKKMLAFIGVTSALLSTVYVPSVYVMGSTGAAMASTLIYILQSALVFYILRRSAGCTGGVLERERDS